MTKSPSNFLVRECYLDNVKLVFFLSSQLIVTMAFTCGSFLFLNKGNTWMISYGLGGAPANRCSTENALSQVKKTSNDREWTAQSELLWEVFHPLRVPSTFLLSAMSVSVRHLSWRLSSMTSCVKPVKGTLELMLYTREGARKTIGLGDLAVH